MKKRRLVSVLLAAAVGISGLSACGGQESGGGGASSAAVSGSQETVQGSMGGMDTGNQAEEGVTITLAQGQGDATAAVIREVVSDWEAKTGNKVEFIDLASDGIDTWITAQFAAGTEPDIMWVVLGSAMDDYFKQGKVMDLTDYYKKENVHNGIKWEDCFLDGVLKGCMDVSGEHYLGVTTSRAEVKLYYNMDLMEELGMEPKAPENVSGLMDMLKVVKEDGRYIPMSVMNSMSWNLGWLPETFTQSLYESKGLDVYNKLNIITENEKLDDPELAAGLLAGVINYDDPQMVEYHRIMKEMSQYFNEDFNAASWEYEALFNEGEAVFNFNGGWFPGQALANGIAVNWGAGNIPYVDDKASGLGRSRGFHFAPSAGECHLFVSQKCADEGRADAAVSLLQYMTDYKTGAQKLLDGLMTMPTVEGLVYPDALASLNPSDDGSETAGETQYDYIKYYNRIFMLTDEMNAMYWNMYTEFMDPSSSRSAEEFCQDVKKALMPLVKDYAADNTDVDISAYAEQLKG